jgi:hypothetical protein
LVLRENDTNPLLKVGDEAGRFGREFATLEPREFDSRESDRESGGFRYNQLYTPV